MSAAPTRVLAHCSNEQRLAALHRYGILDTEHEPAFDDITRLVAHICQTPIAVINFIDEGRQWFKSEIGLGVRQTPLDTSICAHAILQHGLFVVHDTMEDERLRDNPLVVGSPHLRFYAGARLDSPDGQALGTLCVLDYVPRSLTPAQLEALRALSRQVMTQLELRRTLAAQVAAAEELRAAKQAAEHANRMKDHFLATVSHELRTPLSAISLWAHALRGGPVEPKQVDEGLAAILASADIQKKLIDDLLDTSRIAAGKVRLELREVILEPLVRQAVEAVLPGARNKGVRVETDLRAAVGTVWADADRLRQVLWNLLNNAVKFTPPGGRVDVALSADAGSAALRIADTGEGISPDFLPHVFVPFSQADASTTRPHGGLGLGLAIAKTLVELHGGTIRAESPGPGRGATFHVHLPWPTARRDADPVMPSARELAGDGHDLTGTRVLLVEDDPQTRSALATVLRRAGAEVTAVGSAAAALDAFARSRPDVLLSDIGLPDTDGYGLIRQIRQMESPQGRRTPSVAVTAYAFDEDQQRSLEAGFDTHLPKPADADELIEVISNLAARDKGSS